MNCLCFCQFYALDNSGCVNSKYGDTRQGIYMRVFSFGLFLRCTNLVNPQAEPVQLVLSLSHACLTVHDTVFVLYFPISFIDTRVLHVHAT